MPPERKPTPKDKRINKRLFQAMEIICRLQRSASNPAKTCACAGKTGACELHDYVIHQMRVAMGVLGETYSALSGYKRKPRSGLYHLAETKTAVSNELTAGQTLGSGNH